MGWKHSTLVLSFLATAGISAIVAGACAATPGTPTAGNGGNGGSGANAGNGGAAGFDFPDGSSGGTGGGVIQDPVTCDEAALSHSYVGCDFYPVTVDNIVRPIFDFAVVVANAGASDADVTVTRLGATIATATVPANGLATLYLPWVDELKSTTEGPFCGPTNVKLQTVKAVGGAYHLVSTLPVAVYQFSAIEYAGQGGPPGKDWSTCQCAFVDCYSYTNDASLLLPSTAMTGNYRIAAPPTWTDPDGGFTFPPYFAVTGTVDGTNVSVKLSGTGTVAGGSGIPNTNAGGTFTFTVDRGDVVQVVGTSAFLTDLSGSLVTASAPVQVVAGISCSNVPADADACDHLEETVFPAETLGKHYFVTVPTSPMGVAVGHVVRIYGNVNGTQLGYPGGNLAGGPSKIDAGEVVDLDIVDQDFEITGDHEFAVASFQLGASIVSPGLPIDQQKGDPSMSFMSTVEQYRKKYVFLAPADYDVSFVDVVAPTSATVTLDGVTVSASAFTPLSSGFGVARLQLGPGDGGAHVLESSEPAGIQVMGYGSYTSYQYAGGLNLGLISPPPPPS